MALGIEEGVQEKEVDLTESNRLYQNVTSELNQARRETRALITKTMATTGMRMALATAFAHCILICSALR